MIIQQKRKTNFFVNYFLIVAFTSISFFSSFLYVFARGGGGGSGGGSGGGGGGWLYLVVFIIGTIYASYKRKQKIKKAKNLLLDAKQADSSWNEGELKQRVSDVFLRFEKDWSDFDIGSMKEYLTESYYKRMVLELNVLQNENRKNLMENCKILSINLWEIKDNPGKENDSFTVEIKASADDSLIDIKNNKLLYKESMNNNFGTIGQYDLGYVLKAASSRKNVFVEYWDFVREGDVWKLNLIKQKTEDKNKIEIAIVDFSQKNNFFYDPDFGWLMMPNKGVIFRKGNFQVSDINNHVIGYFKDKIVEFYTFIPSAKNQYSRNYIVAQTVLPIQYNDILVRRKRALFNFSPKKLRRIETESNDFNKKFCLWADKADQIKSFELLAPDFMEKIYELPFELNIEIVDNFLYFYAKRRNGINYDKMLEILSLAFDSMKQ